MAAPTPIPHNRPQVRPEDRQAVAAVLDSGWLATGPRVEELERAFADMLGGGRACAVSSGTAALFLALRDLGIGAGDGVAVPSYACSALLNAVNMLGARPLVVDVDDADFTIAAEQVPAQARAVIAVHAYGASADIDACRRHGARVIEDCCQSLGGPQGRRGDAAVYSFSATKIITAGQGGLVWHADPARTDAAHDYRDFDCRPTYVPRFNFLMPDVNAALVLSQFRRLDAIRNRRRAIRARYEAVRPAGLPVQAGLDGGDVLPYRYVLRFADQPGRDDARARFHDAGIATAIPIERYELLHVYLGLDPEAFPAAERIARTTLSLPIFPAMSDGDVNRVAAVLESLK